MVVFPTETVYGLGADAENNAAIEKIFIAKGRPQSHPLIVHIADSEKIHYWGRDVQPYVYEIIKIFWPGPLTIIIHARETVKPIVNANQDSVAIRMPSNLISQGILREFESLGGNGVVAPSANLFGNVSATTAESAYLELGHILGDSNLIVDGGPCVIGLESTILDCRGEIPLVVRPGPISGKKVYNILGINNDGISLDHDLKHPGMHLKHYSPKSTVVINEKPEPGDGLIALRSVETPLKVIRLASPEDLEEFAQQLYESFRLGDSMNVNRIVAMVPQGDELEIAILDRLRKAAGSKG